jgi:sugar phosphate isomerase/epimerase
MKINIKFIPFLALFVAVIMASKYQPLKTGNPGSLFSSAGFKMGVALYSFNHHSFKKSLDMADGCGVKYVEGFSFHKLGEGFGDITMDGLDKKSIALMKKMLREKYLVMASMYAGGSDNLEGWKKYFELAHELNLQYLVCEPGRRQWDMIDSLAGVYHIKIAIHDHVKPSPYWHPDSVLAIAKGHPNIGACADIGHWTNSGLDPVKCLKILDGHIIGMHLKDVDQAHNDVIPGNGIIDFAGIVKELKRQHFNGIIEVECEHNMDNNVKDVKAAVDYVNQIAAR